MSQQQINRQCGILTNTENVVCCQHTPFSGVLEVYKGVERTESNRSTDDRCDAVYIARRTRRVVPGRGKIDCGREYAISYLVFGWSYVANSQKTTSQRMLFGQGTCSVLCGDKTSRG